MNSSMVHHQDTLDSHADTHLPDPHQDTYSKTTLGFWVYLMTDCLLFATLFCTYAVLHTSTFGGPSSKELFNLSSAFIETLILLVSSVACGFAMLASLRQETKSVLFWLTLSFLLGSSFIALELSEFKQMVSEGYDWTTSAFLSAFFTLVGTHGLHVTIGLLWILVLMGQLFWIGITATTFRRLAIFSLFWHFLDLVWISIFTFVYLMGVI